MAKKFEHIDILANLSNDSSSNKLITIYKQSDGWTMWNPLSNENMKAETLSGLNLKVKKFLDEFTGDLTKKGYGKK